MLLKVASLPNWRRFLDHFSSQHYSMARSVSKESAIPKSHIARDESESEQLPSHLESKADHSPRL
jgi:hypothetical protein